MSYRFRPKPLVQVEAMAVHFSCRDDSPDQGQPLRARPCRCDHPVVDEDGLCLCGHYPPATVDHTWAQQAWKNAKAGRPSSPRPFSEHDNGNVYRLVFRERQAA